MTTLEALSIVLDLAAKAMDDSDTHLEACMTAQDFIHALEEGALVVKTLAGLPCSMGRYAGYDALTEAGAFKSA